MYHMPPPLSLSLSLSLCRNLLKLNCRTIVFLKRPVCRLECSSTYHVETLQSTEKRDQLDVLEADVRQEGEQRTPDASLQRSVQTEEFSVNNRSNERGRTAVYGRLRR